MAWFILVASGLLESVWAVALAQSRNFSRLGPSLLFCVAITVSMGGLAIALRTIPVGTGYAVWVGIGTIGTAAYGMTMLDEPATAGRIVCLLLIVAGAVGLKVLHT